MKATMRMPDVRELVREHWQSLALYGGLFVFLGGLLWWKLGTLLPGYAARESASLASADLAQIYANPINAPFKLLVGTLDKAGLHGLFATRLAAAMCSLVALGLFCWLLAKWHGRRTAIIGTLLFGTSAWFLHSARLGAPDVLYLGLLALLAAGYWVQSSTRKGFPLFILFALAAALLYVPGMVWFISLGALWKLKIIDRIFKQHLAVVTAGAVFFLAALIPLGWAAYRNHALIKPMLGLPSQWPAPLDALGTILSEPLRIYFRGEANAVTWLGDLPMLDIFAIAMFVLGGWIYIRNFKLARTQLFFVMLIMSFVIVGLGGPASLTIILPILYLVVAAGIENLMGRWYKVFPKNPIAQGIGLSVLSLVIAITCFYHLRHYYVAWPQAQATRQVYTIQSKR